MDEILIAEDEGDIYTAFKGLKRGGTEEDHMWEIIFSIKSGLSLKDNNSFYY